MATDPAAYYATYFKRYVASISAKEIANATAAALSGQAQRVSRAVAAAMQREIKNSNLELGQIHERVAKKAQIGTIAAYQRRVAGRSGDYRSDEANPKFKRYAGGRLLSALSSGAFYEATPQGIAIINAEDLDNRAKQWYRLNFGAGARASSGQRHKDYALFFFGQASNIGLSLRQFQPSLPFRIPRGVWGSLQGDQFRVSRGGPEFAPAGWLRANQITAVSDDSAVQMQAPQITRGIAATAFLDAVPRIIATQLPFEYTKMTAGWFKQAAQTYTGPIAEVISPNQVARLMPTINRQLEAYRRQTRFRNRL